MKRYLASLSLLAASVFTTKAAHAVSLVLVSDTGGVYDYGLYVDQGFTFNMGQTVELTGLLDVTGASSPYSANDFYTVSYTSDSVTITSNAPSASFLTKVGGVPATYDDFLDVTSTSPTVGDINYTINGSISSISSSVEGPAIATVQPPPPPPAAATPEPSSLVLLGTGLVGLIQVGRRRLSL